MRQQAFLVRVETGHECVTRLPVNKYGGITPSGFRTVRTMMGSGLRYALNLEAFGSGSGLLDAISKYQHGTL